MSIFNSANGVCCVQITGSPDLSGVPWITGLCAGTFLPPGSYNPIGEIMLTFLLWCLLFFFCWPLALLALVLYPIIWLLLLPFRIVGIAVGGVLELVKAIIFLPARVLRGRHA
jgi:hypothetical protein